MKTLQVFTASELALTTLCGYELGQANTKIRNRISAFIENGTRGLISFEIYQRKYKIEVSVNITDPIFLIDLVITDRYGKYDEIDTRILSNWVRKDCLETLTNKLQRCNMIINKMRKLLIA